MFQDGKAPDALRTIGEVAKALGLKQHVLRYWEEQFPMLKPLKRSGGRRYYRSEDVRLVETIDRLVHREGYSVRNKTRTEEGVDDEDAFDYVIDWFHGPRQKPKRRLTIGRK